MRKRRLLLCLALLLVLCQGCTWPGRKTVTIGGQERPRNFVVKTMPALKAGENHTIEINF